MKGKLKVQSDSIRLGFMSKRGGYNEKNHSEFSDEFRWLYCQ